MLIPYKMKKPRKLKWFFGKDGRVNFIVTQAFTITKSGKFVPVKDKRKKS